MKKYKLSFLPLFESDLIEITDYITNNLNNPEVALRLVDDIEIAINRRLETPLAFAPYPTSKNRPYPYYRINIRNFSVFYVVIGDTMEVRRVLYAKRNIDNLLR
jgi:toxin-antitoxin system, toxin component, relE family